MNIRRRVRFKDGQQALISMIFDHFGGPTRVARKLEIALGIPDFPRQYPSTWEIRGHVPLYRVKRVASILRVSPFALNYADLSEMEENPPSWKDVVGGINFLTADQKRTILRLEDPEPRER